MRLRHAILAGGTVVLIVLAAPGVADPETPRVASKGELDQTTVPIPLSHVEHEPHERRAHDPWMQRPSTPPPGVITRSGPVVRGRFESIQVNVDEFGNNIPGDAANEPSIAIDPTDPNKIVIGWRQFDNVRSDFRQAGYAYSHDGGRTWTFPGSLTPGVFRSDPVLDGDSAGAFYYYSLTDDWTCDLFRSTNGGVSWGDPIPAFGGDKAWMAVDRTGGQSDGYIYLAWSWYYDVPGTLTRSTDGGNSFLNPIIISQPPPVCGTMAVAPDGTLYVVGASGMVTKSRNATYSGSVPRVDVVATVDHGGCWYGFPDGPNPGGITGQAWVATDHQSGPCRGHVYFLGSDRPPGSTWLDVRFSRSDDGGYSWSEPIRVNDDPEDQDAHQWFGTMSVAPNGRIDAVWNDTRNTGRNYYSETYYACSCDGGRTWSPNTPVGPMWNSWLGWPVQQKIGDYYDMVSDNEAANLAYATTYNREQDVYFLRILPDCDGNGVADREDIAAGALDDCTGNGLPDTYEPDCNENGLPDSCEIEDNPSSDVNVNGVPDECEPDFDHDTIPDGCDDDIDSDGIPNLDDRCIRTSPGFPVATDGTRLIDTNADCAVDLVDFGRLRNCLVSGGPGIDPGRCADFFDADLDGDADLSDLASFFRAFEGSTGKD